MRASHNTGDVVSMPSEEAGCLSAGAMSNGVRTDDKHTAHPSSGVEMIAEVANDGAHSRKSLREVCAFCVCVCVGGWVCMCGWVGVCLKYAWKTGTAESYPMANP